MKSKVIGKYVIAVAVLILTIIISKWFIVNEAPGIVASLEMESDAMAVVNYYHPVQIKMTAQPAEADLEIPPSVTQPRFGFIKLGNSADSLISIMLANEPDSGELVLYIDKNNNEYLGDDGDPGWDETRPTYMTKDALVDVAYFDNAEQHLVPYPVTFYRYTNKLPDIVVAYRNGYRKGFISLDDSIFKLAVFDDDLDGLFNQLDRGALVIDRDADGVLDGKTDSDEYVPLWQRFSVAGKTYAVTEISPSGHQITVAQVDTAVFTSQELTTESRAPAFRTETITGEIIDLAELRNKVILIDFWATWCKPWQENLAVLNKTYAQYHKRGFEIIGLSLDYDLEHLKQFLREHEIHWPQISDGRAWDMPLVEIYRVQSLPKNFLVDKNGIIRYKDLRRRDIESKVYELLNEPEVSE